MLPDRFHSRQLIMSISSNDPSGAVVSVDSICSDASDPLTADPFYQDYSLLPYEQVASRVRDPRNRFKFPVLLHHLASSGEYADSIVWNSHGRSFEIVDVAKFCEGPSLHYFCTRDFGNILDRLAAYGFRKCDDDHGRMKFYHELFLHHQYWLAYAMKPRVQLRRP
ncbi:hypothetical protein ACHAWF_000662 [Thalassiosira exigua]